MLKRSASGAGAPTDPGGAASTHPAAVTHDGPAGAAADQSGAHRRRSWRSRLAPPVRRTLALLAVALALEYVVVPAAIGAVNDLDLLRRLQPGWVAAAVVAETGSLAAYAMLLRSLLPDACLPFGRALRIVLATTALGSFPPLSAASASAIRC